ncbi:MAG: MYG1 family protein [Patescibacteria group bacterium]
MLFFKKRKILITHSGGFHADDLFATAVLLILNKGNVKIIRTRDPEIIAQGDYVYDVGGIYDPEKNRFDHHQTSGAGSRKNGIEYSSFGLVWKKFGEKLCGSKEAMEIVNNKLATPVDANDNGIDLYKSNFENIFPYTVCNVLSIFSPTALENMDQDMQFFKALIWAKEILKREIKKANDQIEIIKIIQNFYKNSNDKRLVVIDAPKVSRYDIQDALQNFSEPLFAIYSTADEWRIVALSSDYKFFKNRKDFPKAWAGLRDQELQNISGVSDAIFCHRKLFLVGVKTKEGAIKLAELALNLS